MKLLDAFLVTIGAVAIIAGLFQLGTMNHADPVQPTPVRGHCDTGEYLNGAGICVVPIGDGSYEILPCKELPHGH